MGSALWDLIRENIGLFFLRLGTWCLPKHLPLGRALVKVLLSLPILEQAERNRMIEERAELIPLMDEYIASLKATEAREREREGK